MNAVTSRESRTWPTEQALIDVVQTPPQKLSKKPFELDSYGYKVMLDPSRPLLTIAAGTPGVKPSHIIRVGKWTIEGYRWQAPLLAALPSNMAIDSMTVELKLKDEAPSAAKGNVPSQKKDSNADEQVGIHFTAKGKYYVLD
jgi:hypothetical protein